MPKPIFSVVTTAKNEKDEEILKETFENWEAASQIFEEKSGKKTEFLIVDAGNNISFPEIKNSTMISEKIYEEYKKSLYKSKIIKSLEWDSPSIGRNLGFMHAKGRIIIFQDVDALFSTGTELDYKYIIPELDSYDNYFCVMHEAFKKGIVAAAPSARARDTKRISRRCSIMGENYTVWLSTKIPTIRVRGTSIGPSVPGFSFSVLRDAALKVWNSQGFLYDPELAVAEDHKFSRAIGEYGKVSYEKRAGAFIRTLKRVSPGFDILKSLIYAVIWILPYSFPDAWKYRKHMLSI